MRAAILTDTHFGHDGIIVHCSRPEDHEKRIIKGISNFPTQKYVLIHLGDVAWSSYKDWHELICRMWEGKKWLVLGNHDKNSLNWYLDRGWDFVGNKIELEAYGKNIIFTHQKVETIDPGSINIHGHSHNRYGPETVSHYDQNHIGLHIEGWWQPITLKSIMERR